MGVITYKCPNCGGGLTFNAEKQKYKCEYCLSEFSQEELDEIEKRELEKARKQAEVQCDPEPEEAKRLLPPSCTPAPAVAPRSSQTRQQQPLSATTVTTLLSWKKSCGVSLSLIM